MTIDPLPTPSTYTRILLQRWPDDTLRLLEGTGVTVHQVKQQASITVAQQLSIFKNAISLAKDSAWALELADALDVSSHGPLGFAALSAPTLGDGIDVLAKFARIRAPYMRYRVETIDDRIALIVEVAASGLGPVAAALVELVLHVFQSYVEVVLGHRVSEARLLIATAPPKHHTQYSKFFHAPVTFNASLNAFTIPADLAALPSLMYDEKSYRSSLITCREMLDALLQPNDISTRLRHLLASHFDQIGAGAKALILPQQDAFASTLCVSKRTMIRALAAQGTSYRELLAEQQRTTACKLLADARYSVSEIGILLGYGDPANFGRAFTRMSGMSPGQYRRSPPSAND
ncbi:MAG: AraC family transcriptional regulator [Rhodocyclaceae bacterium]|nr:AraC family transcriptional regulator [Rhodocyclaceae bacterium]MBK9624038.1 AraC family transcriptional regulator [Rhodocyclaceae bacterium]MBL0076196.1 AraC family transcriptional regulator [Rhodocyclaceae bacterium]MBP7081758.1 AraC family transcriptional regulator [Rhodocyclaceae bacterium]